MFSFSTVFQTFWGPAPKNPDIASDDVITHGVVPYLDLDEKDDLALVNKRMHRLVNRNPCYQNTCKEPGDYDGHCGPDCAYKLYYEMVRLAKRASVIHVSWSNKEHVYKRTPYGRWYLHKDNHTQVHGIKVKNIEQSIMNMIEKTRSNGFTVSFRFSVYGYIPTAQEFPIAERIERADTRMMQYDVVYYMRPTQYPPIDVAELD